MVLYLENPKDSRNNFQKQKICILKLQATKLICEYIWHYYIQIKRDKITLKKNPILDFPQKIKCLGINVTKKAKDLYSNIKYCLKKLKRA